MNNQNFLLDKDFLKKLDVQQRREVYARITSLSFDEQPMEQLEGLITAGSVNVDGTSAIRRTCSLTMISDQLNLKDYNWAIKTKFRLEVGLRNEIDDRYPDICWFSLGLYIITSFTSSITLNSRTISIQGKDKMCLLTGDLGGNLPTSIDFGKEEIYVYHYLYQEVSSNDYQENLYYKKNTQTLEYELATGAYEPNAQYYVREKDAQGKDAQFLEYKQLPLAHIIREGVHAWAQEKYSNIIINDLDTYGLRQLTYKGDNPIWIFYNIENQEISIPSSLPIGEVFQLADSGAPVKTFEALIADNFVYDTDLNGQGTVFYITTDGNNPPKKTVKKIDYGEDIGYCLTEMVYNGDLISNVGESFSSVLDKIKNMLSDFEYFYNIDGQFIFQKKQTNINIAWRAEQPRDIGNIYIDPMTSSIAYDFSDQQLVSAFNKNPTLNNLKNDYSIWGERTTVNGAKVPIHARYAFHNKPVYYKNFDNVVYTTEDNIYNQEMMNAGENFIISGLTDNQKQTYQTQLSTYKNNINNFLDTHNFKEPKFNNNFGTNNIKYIKHQTRRNFIKNNNYSLPAVWWDLEDWNQFYKIVTGHYANESIYQYHNFDTNNMCSTFDFNFNNVVYPAYEIQELLCTPNKSSQKTVYNYKKCWLILMGDVKTTNQQTVNGSNTLLFFKGSSDTVGNVYIDTYINDEYSHTSKSNPIQHSYFDTSDIANKYHISDNMTIQYLTRYPYQWYIKHTVSNQYEKTKIINNNESLDFRVYIYNPQISPTDGDSILDALRRRIFKEQEWFISHKCAAYKVDWREIIYQMSVDYFANSSSTKLYNNTLTLSDVFLNRVKENNPDYYPTGHTGYEMFYTDIKSFWRELYNPILTDTLKLDNNILSSEYYWTGEDKTITINDNLEDGLTVNVDVDDSKKYWNKKVFLEPTSLNFWLDFLDSGELMQYSIPNIGLRTKAITNNKLTSVYFKSIPNFIFYLSSEQKIENWITYHPSQEYDKSGYTFIQLSPGAAHTFSMSSRYYSIQDEMNNLLYQFSYIPENITITSLPIYHLEPNTHIYVHDDETQINGEYIMTKFTLPLTYNGTMSITANKAPERII